MDGNVHTYKARLVAKGFTQTYGVDYEETFSPVADIRAIRILIAIAAFYDYEIWILDVKTAFLNSYLDEDIYMVQPEGFIDPKHPRKNSSKYSTTIMSTTKAKYIAALEAEMEAVWIRKFISGLGIVPTINEPGVQRGARHYHRRYHYVPESPLRMLFFAYSIDEENMLFFAYSIDEEKKNTGLQ
ncbi:retrotransposon protein, putative, ty1-copia subclass [Tanacetum coccineum]